MTKSDIKFAIDVIDKSLPDLFCPLDETDRADFQRIKTAVKNGVILSIYEISILKVLCDKVARGK